MYKNPVCGYLFVRDYNAIITVITKYMNEIFQYSHGLCKESSMLGPMVLNIGAIMFLIGLIFTIVGDVFCALTFCRLRKHFTWRCVVYSWQYLFQCMESCNRPKLWIYCNHFILYLNDIYIHLGMWCVNSYSVDSENGFTLRSRQR